MTTYMCLKVTTVGKCLLTNVTCESTTFIVWLQQMWLELVIPRKTFWTVSTWERLGTSVNVNMTLQIITTFKHIPTLMTVIGVTYRGYGGYAYPPLFGVGGTVPPTFWACDRKNNSDFPSSSAHVSPYNIQENIWRLGLCPRNRVHRYSQGWGWTRWGLGPQRVWKKLHNRLSCAKGTNIYVKTESLTFSNCECECD